MSEEILNEGDASWNYRIIIGLDNSISIRVVRYSKEGLITSWDMFPADLSAWDVEELWEIYKNMEESFEWPAILERDLENQFLEADKVALPLEDNDE